MSRDETEAINRDRGDASKRRGEAHAGSTFAASKLP